VERPLRDAGRAFAGVADERERKEVFVEIALDGRERLSEDEYFFAANKFWADFFSIYFPPSAIGLGVNTFMYATQITPRDQIDLVACALGFLFCLSSFRSWSTGGAWATPPKA